MDHPSAQPWSATIRAGHLDQQMGGDDPVAQPGSGGPGRAPTGASLLAVAPSAVRHSAPSPLPPGSGASPRNWCASAPAPPSDRLAAHRLARAARAPLPSTLPSTIAPRCPQKLCPTADRYRLRWTVAQQSASRPNARTIHGRHVRHEHDRITVAAKTGASVGQWPPAPSTRRELWRGHSPRPADGVHLVPCLGSNNP